MKRKVVLILLIGLIFGSFPMAGYAEDSKRYRVNFSEKIYIPDADKREIPLASYSKSIELTFLATISEIEIFSNRIRIHSSLEVLEIRVRTEKGITYPDIEIDMSLSAITALEGDILSPTPGLADNFGNYYWRCINVGGDYRKLSPARVGKIYSGWEDFQLWGSVGKPLPQGIKTIFLYGSNFTSQYRYGDSRKNRAIRFDLLELLPSRTPTVTPQITPLPAPRPTPTPSQKASQSIIIASIVIGVITDLHIGLTPAALEKLEKGVETIIEAAKAKEPKTKLFVMVLGDITADGELGNLRIAKQVLDRLNNYGIPYLVLLGNHDVWPYSDKKGDYKDIYFQKVFNREFFQKQFEMLGIPKHQWQFQYIGEGMPNLQNYWFKLDDIPFVCLDFVTRSPAKPWDGVWGWAKAFPETAGFLTSVMAMNKGKDIIIFSHHPLVSGYDSFDPFDPEAWYLAKTIKREMKESKNNLICFAGHSHDNDVITPFQNIDFRIKVVITEALYQGKGDEAIRPVLIKKENGGITVEYQ